jgi:uncharacterized protein
VRRGLTAATFLLLALTGSAQAEATGPLADSPSPYLRMHAADAIHWQPWSDEALAEAKRLERPIFLSIGYASCHWCHVLSRTTLSDERVIALLNAHFVSILVDREQRPDIDAHFMEVLGAIRGWRGSPANFLLTPDLAPLYAAGYVTAERERGQPGLIEVLEALQTAWHDDRDALLATAANNSDALAALIAPPQHGEGEGPDPRTSAAEEWRRAFDTEHGGFGGREKFPMPNALALLLRQGHWHGDDEMLAMVMHSLDAMAASSLRDQLGGAFHRYAVDRLWHVPHFEIMLADNALLAHLYLTAYQVSGKARYAAVARAVLDDLLRRFSLADGGFASSLDSDSDGGEGRYYSWTEAELRAVLGADADEFLDAYFDPAYGLVEDRATLRLRAGAEQLIAVEARLADSRASVLARRVLRPPPPRDDKMLVPWNALALSAFAKAAQVLDDARYGDVAVETAETLLGLVGEDGGLVHSRHEPEAVFLDDYAFLVLGLLDLYETRFERRYLEQARRLMGVLIERFQATPGLPFRFTPIDSASPLPAQVLLREEGLPSGNAAALTALARLRLYTGDDAFRDSADAILAGLGAHLERAAGASPSLLAAFDFSPHEAREVVIVGNVDNPATRRLLAEVRGRLLHGTVVALVSADGPTQDARWPLLAARPLLADRPTAYVCRNRLCDLPVDTPEDLAAQLDRITAGDTIP